MKAFMDSTGVAYRITSTTGDQHASTSWHYKGLAADFAEPRPSVMSPGLLAIFTVWAQHTTKLNELIYAGASFQVKNGRRVNSAYYGPKVMANHRTHVHVAVKSGFRWEPPVILPEPMKKVFPMYDPPLRLEPVVAELRAPEGGVWLLSERGSIYAFGGAPYKGDASDEQYFVERKAARLEPFNGGYTIVSESNERYNYP